MDLKWLEDFLVLAETHSFSRSAELRGVTQSAFSRRIRALEEGLGTDLLSRDSYPVTLTPEGILLRETAEEVVRMIHARRAEFRDHARNRGVQISSGAAQFDRDLSARLADALKAVAGQDDQPRQAREFRPLHRLADRRGL